MEIGQLSMKQIQERLDFLEARVGDSEGDEVMSAIYWDELRNLRQVYDRMIMDSQGKGMQMMTDIMDKSPETRDNYVDGVPVASTEAVAAPAPSAAVAAPHAEPDGDEAPAVNLTINVNGGSVMGKSLDDRAAALGNSDGADIRMPLDLQIARAKALKKSCKEEEASTGDIDSDKVDASDADAKKKEEGEDDEKKDAETVKSQIYRSETETLAKSLLARRAAAPSAVSICGGWAFKALKKSQGIDGIALVVREAIEKSTGSALVMGIKAPASPEASKAAYARIVALNCEIQEIQAKLQDANEPDDQVACDKKLRAAYEKLALAVMESEGLGLKTEDMVVDKPDTRFPAEMTATAIGKSQAAVLPECDVKLVIDADEPMRHVVKAQ